MNMDDHAFAVDVLDAQVNQFAPPQSGGVQSHENGTRFQSACCLDQASHFLRAQYAWRPMMVVLRVRYRVHRQTPFQHTPKKEAQCGNVIDHRAYGQLPFVK